MHYLDVAIGSLNRYIYIYIYDYLDTRIRAKISLKGRCFFFFFLLHCSKGEGRVGVETDSITGWARIMHALGKPTSTLHGVK